MVLFIDENCQLRNGHLMVGSKTNITIGGYFHQNVLQYLQRSPAASRLTTPSGGVNYLYCGQSMREEGGRNGGLVVGVLSYLDRYRLYSAVPLGNQATGTMIRYPTQSPYPDTELTSSCPILIMPSV